MEYFDIVDENGEPTGATVERTEAHRLGIRHRTAHVWIARLRDGRLQLLLQKRSPDKDSFPGCYDISSAGHIPAGSDWVESALRELEEELGVSVAPDRLILCGTRRFALDDVFYGQPFRDHQVTRIYLLWLDLPEEAFVPQPEEISEVRWMDAELVRPELNPEYPHCLVEEELELVKHMARQTSPARP